MLKAGGWGVGPGLPVTNKINIFILLLIFCNTYCSHKLCTKNFVCIKTFYKYNVLQYLYVQYTSIADIFSCFIKNIDRTL